MHVYLAVGLHIEVRLDELVGVVMMTSSGWVGHAGGMGTVVAAGGVGHSGGVGTAVVMARWIRHPGGVVVAVVFIGWDADIGSAEAFGEGVHVYERVEG